ncbi:hypothetical protein C0995_005686, partial [Termitomyces sp. Mi166
TPDTIGDKSWYGSALSPATPPPVPEIRYGEHLRSRGYSESSGEAETEEAADVLAKDLRSSVASVKTTTSGRYLKINEEESELERERRREEIFERMRRILDNSSDDLDPFADGKK